jgi:hypothetical protein
MRWDGARQPVIWTVPAPNMDPQHARLELARRFLHVFGPANALSFAKWAGISAAEGKRAFALLGHTLIPVHTPVGEGLILAADEAAFSAKSKRPASTRLLPSGDTYFLLWGADRALLVPDKKQRDALWTTRVWPGALLVGGEIAGVWRRAGAEVSIEVWRRLSAAEREAVEAEAASVPLPGLSGPMVVRFQS